MDRSLTACAVVGLFIGAVAGAAVATLFPGDQGRVTPADPSSSDDIGPVIHGAQEPAISGAPGVESREGRVFSDRLAQYVDAARLDDRDVLVSRVEAALREPLSLGTMTEIEALLGRLFEIEPRDAVRLAQSADMPITFLSSIFRLWAEIDAQAAIGLLDQVSEPPKERLLALAIIEVAGVEIIDTIVSAGRTLDADGLAMAALVQRASIDPIDALRDVSELTSREAQAFALAEIGRNAARFDPVSAIATAESIVDSVLKGSFVEDLYIQWSLIDLPEFLEHLKMLNPSQEEVSSLFERPLARSAESDAMLVLELGQEVGGRLGTAAEAAALTVLAADDPESAISYLDSVPNGYRRDTLATAIATGYARYDVDAALSWARRLRPPNRQAKQAVMTSIAASDLARAVRIELEDPDTRRGGVVNAPVIPAWFGSRMISDLNDPHGIASQILASDENGFWEERMLETTLSRWALTDPDGAIAWMRSHPGNVPIGALESVAEQLGAVDVDQMISLADMVAPDRRPDWIGRAVGNAALFDANRAMAVTERYRTEPYHEFLVARVISTVAASRGPEAAAQLLGSSPPAATVVLVTRRWARADPREAANWAIGLPDQNARNTAVTDVLTTWAETDVDAATVWAQGMSDRTLRDQVLATICRRFPEASNCG